ncbi:MAG TPA: hypothetical protein VGE84_03480, partial [Allosphingosinicella sp.]
MVHRADLAEVGKAADRPQTAGLRTLARGNGWVLGDELQDGEVDGLRSRPQDRVVALRFEASDQRADVGEVEVGVAPVEEVDRAEAMLLDRGDFLLAEAAGLFGLPEGAVGA